MGQRTPTIGLIANFEGRNPSHEKLAITAGRCIADAGCNLLTAQGGRAIELATKAFCLTPYRTGKSIGIQPWRSRKEARTERSTNPWIEIHLALPNSSTAIVQNSIVASADVLVVVAGALKAQAYVKAATVSGKPVVVFAGREQKAGRYGATGNLSDLSLAKDEPSFAAMLSRAIAPFALTRPTFAKIKGVYETDENKIHSCSMTFPHTCAIRMSEALDKVVSGIKDQFKSSGLTLCPHDFMRGAQDLASVLKTADVFGKYDQGFKAPMQAPDNVKGKKGIICYMNIPSFPNGQGHIDLWDNDKPVGDAYWTADPIWFWHLK